VCMHYVLGLVLRENLQTLHPQVVGYGVDPNMWQQMLRRRCLSRASTGELEDAAHDSWLIHKCGAVGAVSVRRRDGAT
jgi:hypothetical protein